MIALALLLQATTSTTEEEIPRVVGDPLPQWVVLGAAAVLLVAILAAGIYVRGRVAASERRR